MSVVVLGSANVDVVIELDRIPRPGETVITERSARGRGGKGNNQAVASARAGANTILIASVGDDDTGDFLIDGMRDAGIDTSLLRRVPDETSGTAYVMLDAEAENAIVVVAGANAEMTELREAERRAIAEADILLMQLEIPIATVVAAARLARSHGTLVVLNAAPYAELPDELIDAVDLLIVNEHEAALAAGSSGPPEQLGATINERVSAVLITLGAAGSMLCRSGEEPVSVAALKVDTVDTTAAGDAFVGVYAAAKVAGHHERRCIELASAAAALAVQRVGAVASIPSLPEILAAAERYPTA
ncbi:MAG: ribokinase [Cumulibacter sp.]